MVGILDQFQVVCIFVFWVVFVYYVVGVVEYVVYVLVGVFVCLQYFGLVIVVSYFVYMYFVDVGVQVIVGWVVVVWVQYVFWIGMCEQLFYGVVVVFVYVLCIVLVVGEVVGVIVVVVGVEQWGGVMQYGLCGEQVVCVVVEVLFKVWVQLFVCGVFQCVVFEGDWYFVVDVDFVDLVVQIVGECDGIVGVGLLLGVVVGFVVGVVDMEVILDFFQ